MKTVVTLFLSSFLSINVMASETSTYDFSWLDKDKKVYVLQNRKFRKDGKFYLGLSGTKTLSGAFIDAYGANVRLGYFFSEDWGVEFVYSKHQGGQNDTAKGVKEQGAIPFYREQDTVMGGMLTWSPFYAKINTFNKIYYFDWMFGLGVANIATLDNRREFETVPSSEMTSESNTGAIWNTAIRFYMSESWSFRIDFTGTHFQAERKSESSSSTPISKSTTFSNYDLGFGLNYTF